MKALVGAFNQEKALVGAFSVIVQLHRLIDLRHYLEVQGADGGGLEVERGFVLASAVKRSIGEVVQSRRRPLLGPSSG